MTLGRPKDRRPQAEAGFTLFEALVAIALMALILGALAAVTGQWLSNWNRSLLRVQRVEQLTIALDRLSEDLAVAQYVSPIGLKNPPLFRGTSSSVVFVRSGLGPNERAGLEFVQIAEAVDAQGAALVRTRAPFVTLPDTDSWPVAVAFKDPVVLLRAPFRLALSYAAADGVWKSSWSDRSGLPRAVRFELLDGETGLALSTAARVEINLEPPRPETPVEPSRLEGSRVASDQGQR